MKSGLGPVLERLHAALQFGGSLGIRGDSRTHRQRIGLGHSEHHITSQAAFPFRAAV
jgi:hypothetical protein